MIVHEMTPINATTGLSVATYNIRKAIGRDFRRHPERVLETVASLGADIVALQEADYRFSGRKPIFDTSQVRRLTNLRTVTFTHDQNGLGWHGNILLVNPKLRILNAQVLELPGLEPRGGLLIDLAFGDREIRIVSAHLGLLAVNRRRQIEILRKAADPESGNPTIVMGDFNCWGKGRWSLRPLREGMKEVECGKTYPASGPLASLDQIFYSGPLVLSSCGPVRSRLTRMASDHLPARAEFELQSTSTSVG